MSHRLLAVVAALTTVLALAGCGDDDDVPTNETHTASNGDEYNDADVRFASDMIPHHAQALSMIDLTLHRPLDPEVQQLAEDIRAAQAPEIEQMTDWLTAWGEDVPETMRDHANAHGQGGMELDDEMADLENAADDAFQDLFLEMMIEHHEGAIDMAQAEQDEGLFKPAVELARSVESSQKEEIGVMEDLLAS